MSADRSRSIADLATDCHGFDMELDRGQVRTCPLLALPIGDLAAAGLAGPCVVRLKLFTLVDALISRRLGRLGVPDRRALSRNLIHHLGLYAKRGQSL